jgi:hypothetical protein
LAKISVGDAEIHPNWPRSRGHRRKFPWKTQKNTRNALTGPAHRPGEQGEKKQKKPPRLTAELKTRTRGNPVDFPYLAQPQVQKNSAFEGGRQREPAVQDAPHSKTRKKRYVVIPFRCVSPDMAVVAFLP